MEPLLDWLSLAYLARLLGQALSQLNNSGCPFLHRAIIGVDVMVELTQPCKEWDALCSERGCLLPVTLHLRPILCHIPVRD